MSSGVGTEHPRACELHSVELMDRPNSVPRLRNLQKNFKEFLSCIQSSLEKINGDSGFTECVRLKQRIDVRIVLKRCIACSRRLSQLFPLYRRPTDWVLDSKEADRALVLDISSDPLDRICEILSYLTYILPCWSHGEWAEQKRPEARDEWFKAASDNVFELERRIDIARELASINVLTMGLLQCAKSLGMTPCANKIDSLHNGDLKGVPVSRSDGVWERLRQDLATEGIWDEAVERIEDRLKDFVRNIVQNETPHEEPLDQNTESKNPTPGSSISSEVGGGFDASRKISDIVVVLRENLDRLLPGNYDSVAPEILELALQSATSFKHVLRMIYHSACRDPCKAATYARFAKYLQNHSTAQIRKSMSSQWAGKDRKYKGPVSSYFWKRCWGDWQHGKHDSMQIDLDHFALGLSSFIGQMVRYDMFDVHQVHLLLRRLLETGSPVGTAEFVALYQLLRTVGSTVEGGKRTSEEMNDHFQRIDARVKFPNFSNDIKTLVKELKEMRKYGWTVVKTRAESKALGRAVAKIKNELSRRTSSSPRPSI